MVVSTICVVPKQSLDDTETDTDCGQATIRLQDIDTIPLADELAKIPRYRDCDTKRYQDG
jgi:hypothetical protein